jgi:hypothetical protein
MKPVLDRIDFRPDQSLNARDLEQSARRAADLLALHAARGHDVWGVANGYLCYLSAGALVVGPGVALDAHGRQLINSAPRTIPLPAGDGQIHDLVARWAEPAELRVGGPVAGLPAEAAALRWESAGALPADPLTRLGYSHRVRVGLDVPIARVTVPAAGAAQSITSVDTTARPVAHGLVRPKIATGHILQSSVTVTGTYTNWTMFVSCATAGFLSESPTYLVTLDDHPFGDTADLGSVTPGQFGPAAPTAPPDLVTRMSTWQGPFVTVDSKGSSGFTLRVSAIADSDWARNPANHPSVNPVAVSWIGIETPSQPFALTSFLRNALVSLNIFSALGGG